jgi:hypothetical protein
MERVTTRQAAHELNMDLDTLQYLMRNNRLPIGHAVKKEGKKRYSYYIYRGLLNNYILFLNGMSASEKTMSLYGRSTDTD